MILTGKSVRLSNKQVRHDFWVIGTTPTSAKVTYDVVNSSDKVIYTKTEDFAVESLGDNRYRFDAAIPADVYTVKLNTEANYLEYESEYSINSRLTDAPLIAEWGINWINFWIPICDSTKIKFELYSPDGKQLDFKGPNDDKKAWEILETQFFTINGKQRLYLSGRLFPTRVRESGSVWVQPQTYASLYVRVLGISPILNNSILSSALLDQETYKATTLGKMVDIE